MSFTITVRGIIIGALWVAGVVVAVFDAVYAPPLAALSVGFMIAGALVAVIGRIDRYAASWETAYEAGREVTKVRKMR